MKTLAALGWGARFTSVSVPNCCTRPPPSLKTPGPKVSTGSPLLLQDIDLAKKTDRNLAHREPVRSLPVVAKQGHVHFPVQFANERRADIREVIKQPARCPNRGRALEYRAR